MDDAPENAREYVLGQRFPWNNYFFAEGTGFDSTFARNNGINIIPFVAVVDQEGNVVRLHARGGELEPALREALGLPSSLLDDVEVPTQ